MADPQTAALVAHIFAQTQANITFLAAQNHISATDASDIVTRLATAQTNQGRSQSRNGGGVDALANNLESLAVAQPTPGTPNLARRNVPPPPSRPQKAKAIWAYNEDGQEPNDLSFAVGEIIEIVDETNADWWTGKCRGRQGLFPSNHIEKIQTSTMPAPPAPIRMPSYEPPVQPQSYGPPQPYRQQQGFSEKPAYKPFGAAYHGTDAPPPANTGTNSVGLQQAPGQEQKKSKFGNLGNTMANSAAGGVGFGAGAAIGGGLVRAIF